MKKFTLIATVFFSLQNLQTTSESRISQRVQLALHGANPHLMEEVQLLDIGLKGQMVQKADGQKLI